MRIVFSSPACSMLGLAIGLGGCGGAVLGPPGNPPPPSVGHESVAARSITARFATGRWIDLTHPFDAETVYWPTEQGFRFERGTAGPTPRGYYYAANRFATAEHGGTHLDAPRHFAAGGHTTDRVEIARLVGGTTATGPDAVPLLRFPGLAPQAAKWLVEHRRVKAVGIDTASIDHGPSTLFGAHVALCTANVPILENVADLAPLPAAGAFVAALPMKIAGGSGGPLRIVARLPD